MVFRVHPGIEFRSFDLVYFPGVKNSTHGHPKGN